MFLTPERTLSRKAVEILMALSLEWHFSKRTILEAYLATVYLGHDQLVGVYGLAEGARVYLGKDVSELTLGEGAPRWHDPGSQRLLAARHPERALARRDQVVAHLERLHRISPAEAAAARSEILPPPFGSLRGGGVLLPPARPARAESHPRRDRTRSRQRDLQRPWTRGCRR